MSTKAVIIRFALYTAVVLGMLVSLPSLVEPHDISVFKEGGAIEWFQFALIAMAAAILWAAAAASPLWRDLLQLLGALATIAAIREQDSLLGQLLPVLGWYGPAGLVLAWIGWLLIKRHRTLTAPLDQFVHTAAFGILWAGFILVVGFAQLVGHSDFLRAIMGDDYHRHYKRVIEETCETFGYLLVFIGAIETMLTARWHSARDADAESAAGVIEVDRGRDGPAR